MADGSLIFDTKVDESGFKKGLNRLKSIGSTALKVVGKAAVAVGTAVSTLGGYALKASIDFESAFAGVRKTVDATEEEFKMLEKGIRDMSKRMPQSASEIAQVAEAAGQLGIETKNILGFTETMVMLGDATNLTSEQAATALARLANITGMSQKDFDRLGSTIVALGNNLATTESEIVEMGLRLAGTASQVGMTEDQILALAAAMSSVGINAEAGGSSMSRVIQKINTEVLSAGKNLDQFAKIAGMSAEEFSKVWREKPQEAILAFVKGLDEINKSGGDVTSTLKELGINSIQEIDTLLRLAGANETLADALGISAEAWEENIALQKEAEQRYQTTESLIKILKNNIDDLAISVGDELKESMRDGIGTAIEMVEQLTDALETRGLTGLVEELGTVLADVATQAAEFAPKMLDTGTDLMSSFIDGIKNNKGQLIQATLDILESFTQTFLTIVPEMIILGVEILTGLIQGLVQMMPELISKSQEVILNTVNAIVENLPLILEAGIQIIIMLAQGIAEMMPELITQFIELVIMLADVIIENLPMMIEAGLQIILAIAQGLIENLPTLIAEVPRIINSFANAIYDNLPTVLKAGVQIILMLIKGLIQSIPTIVANIPQIIMAIVNVFTLYNWAQLGKNLMKWLGEGIVNMRGNLLNIGKSIAEGVTNAIKNLFQSGTNIGQGLVNNLITGIKGMISNLLSTAGSLAKDAIETIYLVFLDAPNIGKSLVQGLWNGINNMTGWILDRIKGFGKSIMNGIKGVFGIKSPSKLMKDEVGENLTLGIGVGFKEGVPKLQKDIEKELGRLVQKMKATVEFESSTIGTKISAGSSVVKTTQNIIHNDNGITQNININQPVESPSEMARHIKRVGRELALGY